MRRSRLDSTKSLRLGSALFAMLPLGVPAELSRQGPTCAVAIELQVKTPLSWGEHEWHVMTREVERIWEPYGLTLCWADGTNPCAGWEVRLRVLVADNLPPKTAAPVVKTVVGRILFDSDGPSTDVALSVNGARGLVAKATLGDRQLDQWPATNWNAFVPRVLGRALAHEIGHYILGSREHTHTGLMTPSFRPDQVTFGPTSWFSLTPDQVAALHLRCPIQRVDGASSFQSPLAVPPTLPGFGRGD
jgi:hypothetical protein